jgi:predicted lipid carrier protein YhbT
MRRGTAEATMAAAVEFLRGLVDREEPLLRALPGTLRFDLRGDGTVDRWFVSVEDGSFSVSRRNAKADCVARMDVGLADALARGEANAVSATLRGDIEIEGDMALLLAFQRLFPGPPDAGGPADRIGSLP